MDLWNLCHIFWWMRFVYRYVAFVCACMHACICTRLSMDFRFKDSGFLARIGRLRSDTFGFCSSHSLLLPLLTEWQDRSVLVGSLNAYSMSTNSDWSPSRTLYLLHDDNNKKKEKEKTIIINEGLNYGSTSNSKSNLVSLIYFKLYSIEYIGRRASNLFYFYTIYWIEIILWQQNGFLVHLYLF